MAWREMHSRCYQFFSTNSRRYAVRQQRNRGNEPVPSHVYFSFFVSGLHPCHHSYCSNKIICRGRSHKAWARHVRLDGEAYVDSLAAWISHKSANDVSFGACLNPHVCCMRFHLAVEEMVNTDISPLTVCFKERGGYRVVIASQGTINKLRCRTGATAVASVEDAKRAVSVDVLPGKEKTMLKEFISICSNPSIMCASMDFDECVTWSTAFFYLTPIPDGAYLRGLYDRLKRSQMRIDMTYMDLVAMGPGGMMSCTCSAYLHRAWCIHACACAFKRKIITGYPQNKDPTPRAHSKKCAGRPVLKKQKVDWERNYEAADDLCDVEAEAVAVDVTWEINTET